MVMRMLVVCAAMGVMNVAVVIGSVEEAQCGCQVYRRHQAGHASRSRTPNESAGGGGGAGQNSAPGQGWKMTSG